MTLKSANTSDNNFTQVDRNDHCPGLLIIKMSQGWTGMYTLVVPSLSTKFIKNNHQNLSV